MGSGDKHLIHLNIRHHLPSGVGGGGGGGRKEVPKGCLAVMVGQEGEEQQRFVVPVVYLNHPLFLQLLKEAEDEYGFDHKGAITLPCHVADFRYVQSLIDRERLLFPSSTSSSFHSGSGGGHHHHHHHGGHILHHTLAGCFKA